MHISHYGRICPIETPEGTNIGLISSLAIYAGVDEYGFLVTPYQKLKNGQLTEEIEWLRADQEHEAILAPADAQIEDGRLVGDTIIARHHGDFQMVPVNQVQYIDVAPAQMVGVSAGLIPFLEHDDANRALMGSNMQRQAVPLLITEPPLVATGLEQEAALNSSMLVRAQRKGVVTAVDAEHIEIGADVYKLRKFVGLNERTCQNQKPIINVGDKIEKGQVIADGAATHQGELALGRNVLAAFMAWDGFNFEDAIIISEELVETRHLHLDPHRGVRHRNPRDEAGPRGVHPRHPQRQRETAPQPGRDRHRARGHLRPAGRHPGGQGLAQVEDRADARRKTAARHLRPRRRRREERFAGSALRRGRHRHRHAEVLPPHEPHRGRTQDLRGRAERGRGQGQRADRRWRSASWSKRSKRCSRRNSPTRTTTRWSRTRSTATWPSRPHQFNIEKLDIRSPQRKADVEKVHKNLWPAVEAAIDAKERHAELDETRRRAPQRRAANGQGLRGRQAGDFGGRQDGRPARQQGRDRQDPAPGRHALPGRRHARANPAESAGRSQPYERGPDS